METNEDLALSDAPNTADDLALYRRAPSIFIDLHEQVTAFEIELRRAALASQPGLVPEELAHELRGRLNAIVLHVQAIKCDSKARESQTAREVEHAASEILALELELRRLKQALKNFLAAEAPAKHIEEAFGKAS